ncbi:MAG TPA: FAD-dependent monooxygenase [Burkholderiaceae bacterium]|nr:FAD-dependent monooxygenase [Burkholderiaceae bacterium]
MDTDVLIVGAGPTGLMLANQLVRRGVRTLIVDRHAGPSQQTRALGVQARTLEIYAQLGIVERALALGKRGTGANLWADGRKTARVPLGDAGRSVTPYPYILILGQDDNERIMGERLHEAGLTVQWNTELLALAQHADHASVTLKDPDGSTRAISAAWVAGCDGAHSAVRERNGIAFDGAPYEHVFFVADVDVTGNMVAEEVNVYLWRAGFHLFFPMRGKDHWRIVGIVPPELRGKPDLDFDAVVPSVRGEAGSLSFTACSWFSTYRIHHRSARHFRDRRCFLLGDAAHIHSPVGAQGMNTGLQDAYNLAWKLALVVQGRADAALLDSYEAERLPVAQRLLATTDRAFRLIVSDSWWAGLLRTKVLARVGALALGHERVQSFAFRTVSQTGIHYRDSALSMQTEAMPSGAPRPGDRFPWLTLRFGTSAADDAADDLFERLDDTRFHLLVFGSTVPDLPTLPISDMLDVSSVASNAGNVAELARVAIPLPSFYLLRPDGHVGMCGRRVDTGAIARYVGEGLRMLATLPSPPSP